MKVFKFGGASVKDADAVRNVAEILLRYPGEKLMVVVSAMGKMTNLLEEIHKGRFHKTGYEDSLKTFLDFHRQIALHLFQETSTVDQVLSGPIREFTEALNHQADGSFDKEYDRIVGFGEIFSTHIIQAYLPLRGISCAWLDARQIIRTDECFRSAGILWEQSATQVDALKAMFQQHDVLITQGFIGSTLNQDTTTLGREGSDFTASILAFLGDAESVTIWKDVPGMLNADPKWFKDTVKLDKISFREAIELAYYGASVIHPKTIKPLQNKGIPLWIKSFMDPTAVGSVIQADETLDGKVPSYIFKNDQVLVSISPRDFSFVAENNLSEIFELLAELGIHLSLMENSAISFSFCIDRDDYKLNQLHERLRKGYQVRYNTDLTLITIRHYNESIIQQLLQNRELLLEQRSRNTVRMIVK